MGRNREARMLAAADVIEVKGKRYKLRPVVAQHLCDMEREALRFYKHQYLQTYVDEAQMLGSKDYVRGLLEKKLEEVAKWDLGDLPQKDVYDVGVVTINDDLRQWFKDTQTEVPQTPTKLCALLNTALDRGQLSPEQLKKMTGKFPQRGKVRYDQWWVTALAEGMISLIISSLTHEHPEMTREDIAKWPFTKLAEAARIVEHITTPNPKNT